ncbi:MAG: Kdo2-lipid lauroyltransferase/acyltransferase [Acidobacteriota bacterium]|jgi:KDO2-lipid IV(A) lauroyltransferase|nr:Kdo2-lipid lauroyltransferase/acyltransferase [Acidobacteriota bacterium]
MPRSTALAFGRTLGRLGWALSRRDRRRSLDHLSPAFPGLSEEKRRRIARQAFLHQGMNAAELLHLLRRDAEEILPHLEIQGWENVEAARATGRPILVLTGHCGNWELIAVPTRAGGYPLAAIARPLDDPQLQELLVSVRRHLGSMTIARGTRGAARQILGVLRTGGGIAMLIDQDTKVDGVWVPFFGRPAFTPVGPAEMALKQDMRVVPTFIERRPDGGHLLRFLPILDLPDDPREATARMTAEIEKQIRRRPEQWVWWHKRWRRQPPEGA